MARGTGFSITASSPILHVCLLHQRGALLRAGASPRPRHRQGLASHHGGSWDGQWLHELNSHREETILITCISDKGLTACMKHAYKSTRKRETTSPVWQAEWASTFTCHDVKQESSKRVCAHRGLPRDLGPRPPTTTPRHPPGPLLRVNLGKLPVKRGLAAEPGMGKEKDDAGSRGKRCSESSQTGLCALP